MWIHAGHCAQDSVIFAVSDTEQTTTCNSTTEVDDDCESVKLAFATSLPSNVSVGVDRRDYGLDHRRHGRRPGAPNVAGDSGEG